MSCTSCATSTAAAGRPGSNGLARGTRRRDRRYCSAWTRTPAAPVVPRRYPSIAPARGTTQRLPTLLAAGARWGRAFQNDEGLSPYEAATGRSKRIILAAIAERETTRRRLRTRRGGEGLTDWVKTAETIDEAGKLTLIRDRVAVLVPPQTAENDAVEITRPSSPRPGSPRPEGTMFDPEVPVFLALDALAQLFQIDGHSRRCAIDTIERVAAHAAGRRPRGRQVAAAIHFRRRIGGFRASV